MELQHGSDESAVLLLHEEAAYADLGTVTPELIITRGRVVVLRVMRCRTRDALVVAQDWSDWSWATAPPRRVA